MLRADARVLQDVLTVLHCRVGLRLSRDLHDSADDRRLPQPQRDAGREVDDARTLLHHSQRNNRLLRGDIRHSGEAVLRQLLHLENAATHRFLDHLLGVADEDQPNRENPGGQQEANLDEEAAVSEHFQPGKSQKVISPFQAPNDTRSATNLTLMIHTRTLKS